MLSITMKSKHNLNSAFKAMPSLKFVFALIFSLNALVINANNNVWTGTWATATQPVEPNNMPPAPGLTNNTFRQIIRVSIGGETLRLRFSNLFSKSPLTIKSVGIADAGMGSEIAMKSSKNLKFKGKKGVIIDANGEITCDPIKFKLKPGSNLSITICYGETPKDLTGHPASRTTSYLITGNTSTKGDFSNAIKTDHYYTINRVEVLASKSAGAIAILGNSIADGRGSGIGKQNRWPDVLSNRLQNNSSTKQRGILNVSIGGSGLLYGGLNLKAIDRLERDVFTQNNVKWLIITMGVNDIGSQRNAEAANRTANSIIETYKKFIELAHARGIKVYGCPILPFAKSMYDADYRQTAKETVNNWIRTSNTFDGVIDFDPSMRNPEDPSSLLPNVHDKDWLHPNELGYKLMGEAIDLKLFE